MADNRDEVDAFVKWRAWARQTLGLSLEEFGALTPREIEIELETAAEIRKARDAEENFRLRLFDAHMAALEMLVHNANYRRPLKTEDFKLLQETKPKLSPEVVALDAKLRAEAQERIRKKRRV